MKKGWQTKRLGDVAAVCAGNSAPQDEALFKDGTIPFFRTADAGRVRFGDICESEDYLNDAGAKGLRRFAPGTILFPKSGASTFLNHRVVLGVEGCVSSHLATIAADEKQAHPRFLLYFLSTIAAQDLVQDHAYPSLNLPTIAGIEVHLPPLPEQQRIVGLLDEAFAGFATAKANAEKNLHNARALFESHLQSVFTQRGKGWVEKRLGDENLLEIIDGDRSASYPKASDFHDEGYCLFLSTKNVRPGGFDFDSTMFITADKDRQLRKGKLKRGDVVLTTRGTIGNIGLYSEDVHFDHIRINSGMLIFRSNKRALLPSYLFELLRSDIVKDQIRKQTTGAAQPQLPIKTLVSFTIPVPTSLDEQHAIVRRLRAFEPETQRLSGLYERKLTALEALKKSLLHHAFTGQL